MKFGEKLKSLREAAGLTQESFAAGAGGVSLGAIRNYEQGIRLPTFPIVAKLAAALGTDCTAFAGCSDVNGEPEKKSKKNPKK